MSSFGYRKAQDLPATIPVFPLAGALLLPRSTLPLNIFEPRYLNMVDDALSSDRMIGMVQPAAGDDAIAPVLADVGCAGRITTFSETDDGRYLITLTGVCRFRVGRELEVALPYRRIEPVWSNFELDLSQRDFNGTMDRDALSLALRHYADARGFEIDWSAAADAPLEMLVNAICAACPFDVQEKQLLLEAETVADRCDTLVALLELGAAGPPDDTALQ